MTVWSRILFSVLFVAAAASWFLLSTVLGDQLADGWLAAVAATGAFAVALTVGLPRFSELRSLVPRDIAAVTAAGVVLGFIAPLLVLSNRFTDAPPGSETLFFTTAVWGVVVTLAGLAVPAFRPSLLQVAFGAAGLLGTAGLLANWERPSSFSPFVRYPQQEIMFVLAGVLWAAAALWLLSVVRRVGLRLALVPATGSASVIAVAYALATRGLPAAGTASLPVIAIASLSFGALLLAWFRLATPCDPIRPSSLWLLPPVAVTGLGILEQAVSPRGPDPVVWVGALGGIALTIVGVTGVWLAGAGIQVPAQCAPAIGRWRVATLLLAGSTLAFGLVTLLLPAFSASVTGNLSTGAEYQVSWLLEGWESAAGWLGPMAGALLLTGALGLGRSTWPQGVLAAAGAAVSVAVYPLLAATPLHTWNRWIPVEIQAEYGTEYVLLEFATMHDPMRLATLALAGVTAAVLLLAALRQRQLESELATVRVDEGS